MSVERSRDDINDLLADALRISVRLETASPRLQVGTVNTVIEQVRTGLANLDERRHRLEFSQDDAIFRNMVNGVRMHLRYLGVDETQG